MKILVTGNQGYIGTKLTEYFLKNTNYSICGLDTGYFKKCITNDNFKKLKFRQVYKDIRNVKKNDLKGIDTIIHLASISNDPIGNEFKKITNAINLQASKKIFKLALNSNVKKFVFASSCSIYGASGKQKKKETHKLKPLTAYAKSKVKFEEFLKKKSSKKLKSIILRFATACGESDRMRLDLVINDFVTKAYLFKKIVLLSKGTSYRPFISTKDMCRSIHWASDYQSSKNFLIVNAGSDKMNFKITDLAKNIAKKIKGTKVLINENAKRDKRTYRVDFSKFKKLSGKYYPLDNLESVINRILKQCKKSSKIKLLKENNFYNSDLIRLSYLKKLLQRKKLNKNFIYYKK